MDTLRGGVRMRALTGAQAVQPPRIVITGPIYLYNTCLEATQYRCHLSKDGGLIAVQLLASHLKPLLRLGSDIPLGLPLYLPLIQALIDSLCHHRMNLALTLPV
jgi:hypothetical protein